MRKKKKKLNYRKERVVLSDVLPYEVPATFSNRYFYRFLINHDVEYARGSTPGKSTINWKEGGPALERIIRLIFGVDEKTQKTSQVIQKFDRSYRQSSLVVKGPDLRKAPYKFRISHKGDRFRELAICHPVNQLQVIEFYHSHKELLIYSCSASPYSIRRPHRVAQYTYHRDKTHYDALSEEIVSVEEEALEYENLRSFFVFKDYSNVYKFYESYKFHRAEKKYDKLLRLDVSKCFESIYSHSVTWLSLIHI